LRKPY